MTRHLCPVPSFGTHSHRWRWLTLLQRKCCNFYQLVLIACRDLPLIACGIDWKWGFWLNMGGRRLWLVAWHLSPGSSC
jgi:hypothetical protein